MEQQPRVDERPRAAGRCSTAPLSASTSSSAGLLCRAMDANLVPLPSRELARVTAMAPPPSATTERGAQRPTPPSPAASLGLLPVFCPPFGFLQRAEAMAASSPFFLSFATGCPRSNSVATVER